MNLEEFIDMIRQQEIKLYNDCIEAVKNAYDNASESVLKDSPWVFWREIENNVCADYDVKEEFRKKYLGEDNYSHIEKDIEEHLIKLSKTITKITGTVFVIEQINDTDYSVKGANADMTIRLTPAKLSSSKNVMKSKIKVLDFIRHEEELVEKEPSKFEESEYVKEWKQRELEGYKTALQSWKETLAKYEKEEEDAKQHLRDLVTEYREKNGKEPEVENGKYVDEELHKAAQEKRKANDRYFNIKNSNAFFRDYGYNSKFEEMAKKMIDKHFEELQAKVEKKIGRIIKIESFGGDDYAFNGEKGDCVVEVIWAGGYNIQRLHTRWIVKNWNIEEEY